MTTLPGATPSYPVTRRPVWAEFKTAWSDAWTADASVEVRGVQVRSGGDVSRATLRRYFGRGAEPGDTAYSDPTALGLAGAWCRVRYNDGSADSTLFQGRVSEEDREQHGSDPVVAGVQDWVATGPEALLKKIPLRESVWSVGGAEAFLGWTPDFNLRDRLGHFVGNRSTVKLGGGPSTYVFGEEDRWTYYDILEYAMLRWVDEGGTSGPAWHLTGQASLLEAFTDPVRMGEGMAIDRLLGLLIPRSRGLGYAILPADDGFDLRVFALSATAYTVESATLPANPNTLTLDVADDPEAKVVMLSGSTDQRYGTIRVVGERIVACGSLWAADTDSLATLTLPTDHPGTLVPRWTPDEETAYQEGTGTPGDAVEEHDAARQADAWEHVYRHFGCVEGWGFHGGDWLPVLDASGDPTGRGADQQSVVRNTLSWIPLQQFWDYSADPPTTDHTPPPEAEFLAPVVWIYRPDGACFTRVEELGIGVRAADGDWGIRLTTPYNHFLAEDHWNYAVAAETDAWPEYDHETLCATIAIETDQRLMCEIAVEGAAPSDGVLEIRVPDAHFWWLAPRTAVGVPADDPGTFTLSPAAGVVLRNDAAMLHQVLAGTIARYQAERARSRVPIHDIRPWTGYLGYALTSVITSAGTTSFDSPVTGIAWDVDNGLTTLETGFPS